MEDKIEIVKRLKALLIKTRAGSDIEDLILNSTHDKVTIQFKTGHKIQADIAGDSGIAIIHDVIKML